MGPMFYKKIYKIFYDFLSEFYFLAVMHVYDLKTPSLSNIRILRLDVIYFEWSPTLVYTFIYIYIYIYILRPTYNIYFVI